MKKTRKSKYIATLKKATLAFGSTAEHEGYVLVTEKR